MSNPRSKIVTDPETVARINAAIEEEEACKEATIAQARKMFRQRREAVRANSESAARDIIAAYKAERERLGLSLADIAERTGINRSNLSRLENADAPNPTIETLVTLAKSVGKTVSMKLAGER